MDGRYRDSPDAFEAKIEQSEDLLEAEEEFWMNNETICSRFYQLFDSIYKYISDLNVYLQDLKSGVFIQHTLEGILFDKDGKQLLSEALYLYGTALLLMDKRIPGIVRERLLIAVYRHKNDKERPNWEEVWRLCHATGYTVQGRKPQGYPEDYFARIDIDEAFVEQVVSRLRSDDIYSQIVEFPDPTHRSTALSTQARMLYVILYFIPDILHQESATMREIVDRHFSDNWVIALYMGYTVDLSDAWDTYKAAKAALANTLQPNNQKRLITHYSNQVGTLLTMLDGYLTKGVLTEEYVLDNVPQLLSCLRNCNVAIRWLVLHRTSRPKKDLGVTFASPDHVLTLILDTAQFEFILKHMFSSLLKKKRARWDACKTEANQKLTELGEYFSGQQALAKGIKDENLDKWFKGISSQVDALDFTDSTRTGRKLQQLMQALKDIEDFHQIDTSLQVKQFLSDIRELLQQMIWTANIKDSVLATLSLISDMSYAWLLIDDYVDRMHVRIKSDSFAVLKLRSTFQKLATVLDLPLVRIVQANSSDIVSVSQYYSEELVGFVRRVMQIIPLSMFQVLEKITQILTYSLQEPTARIVKTDLREFSQLEQRRLLAQFTHQVSVLTEGILAMEDSLMGVIKVNFKEVLEDGIRKELVTKITNAMHETLIFNPKVRDFEQRLQELAGRLDGFRTAFEYISDYIKVYGLKVWQEEYSRICNFMVEQECNKFLKNKIYPWQSEYQSTAIPIAIPTSPDPETNNFMGRLVQELMRQVDPARNIVYVDSLSGWYDATGKEVLCLSSFSLMNRSISTIGLAGADKLLCFRIVRQLQQFISTYKKVLVRKPEMVSTLREVAKALEPLSATPSPNTMRYYAHATTKMAKYLTQFGESFVHVGLAQLIRRQIGFELNFACKLDSNHLSCSLEAINEALLTDVRAHYTNPDKPYPGAGGDDNPILSEVSKYLDWAGISDPFSKIYLTSESLEQLPLLVFLVVVSQMAKLQYEPRLCSLVCKDRREALDGPPFVVGVITLLKQFHSSHTRTFLEYLGQYLRSHIVSAFGR
eukprot:c13971_g1_i1.p1 GENE.c13971_g1_i1~~c13971_g1_i1.p1  ORF type:complete len:1115 (+),score=343.04 c13971_g1_i1:206-3346(+)